MLIALLSIYPTRLFLSWRRDLKQNRSPAIDARTLRRVRAILHAELALVVLLILNAALMAKGIGYFG